MQALSRAARLYISFLVVLAGGILIFGAPGRFDNARGHSDVLTIVLLATLFVLLESSAVAVGAVGMSLSYTITLASILIVGPWGAAVVGASALVTMSRDPMSRRLFNASQFAIAAYIAGNIYVFLGGVPGDFDRDFRRLLLPVAAADLAYLVANGLFVTTIVVLANHVPVRQVLIGTIVKSAPSYLAYGVFGLVLAVLWVGLGIGPLAAVLLLLPLFVARWAISQFSQEQQAYEATIRTLVQAVETKDSYTRGHSERVAHASVMIARVVGMREDRVSALRYAGILHDVGKLGVPTKVLQKSGKLTEEEFAAIKLHPLRGMEMLGDIEFLDEAFKGILHHHERLDGLGYPLGLKGSQIPEFARVIAVADAFDSMTSTRSYRNARSVEDAVRELQSCKGSQFDPGMVDALVKALAKEPWALPAAAEPSETQESESLAPLGFDHDDPSLFSPRAQATER